MPAKTDVVAYPVFTTKAQMLDEVLRQIRTCVPNYEDLMYRLSNTDTSTFADPTARKDG